MEAEAVARLIAGCIGRVAESECWGDEARKAIPETGRLRAAGLGAAEKPGREELPGPMPWWSLLWPGSEGHGAGDGCVQRSTWGDSSQPLPPPPDSCRAHPSLHPQNVPQPVPVAQLRLEPFAPPCAKPCLPRTSPRPCPCPAASRPDSVTLREDHGLSQTRGQPYTCSIPGDTSLVRWKPRAAQGTMALFPTEPLWDPGHPSWSSTEPSTAHQRSL